MSKEANVTWQEVDDFISKASERFPSVSGVYGPPRGGLVFAVMLSHALSVPLLMAPTKGCLIVDDIVDTGKTLEKYSNSDGYVIASMFYHKQASFEPDFWVYEKTDQWIKFPWEVKSNPVQTRKYRDYDVESLNKNACRAYKCSSYAMSHFYDSKSLWFDDWYRKLLYLFIETGINVKSSLFSPIESEYRASIAYCLQLAMASCKLYEHLDEPWYSVSEFYHKLLSYLKEYSFISVRQADYTNVLKQRCGYAIANWCELARCDSKAQRDCVKNAYENNVRDFALMHPDIKDENGTWMRQFIRLTDQEQLKFLQDYMTGERVDVAI